MENCEELPAYRSKDVVVSVDDDEDVDIDEKTSLSCLKSKSDKPKIPDGGWGWMVVTSSLFISLIQDGISFSFGVLFVEFTEEFHVSKSSASWIGCLFVSVPLLTGPVMSALVDKYGCRSMTMLGGLVSATGFILSFWAKSVVIMYVTFGVVSGMGLGLTYITAVVSIAFWFDKKRNLAVGLGACGTGIGTIIYAPFTNFLVQEFGWRWSLILLAGTLLNICVCGAVMRDPDWIIEQNKQLSSKASSVSNLSTRSEKISLDAIRDLMKSGKDAEYILHTLAMSIERDAQEGPRNELHSSALNLPTFIKQNETVPVEVLEQLQQNKKLYRVILQNYPSLLQCRSTSEKGLNKMTEDSIMARIPVTFSLKLKKSDKQKPVLSPQFSLPESPVLEPLMALEKKPKLVKTDTKPWLVKQLSGPSHPQNYFKNVRFPRHSLVYRGAILNKNKYKLRASSCPNIYKVSMTTLTRDDEDAVWYSAISKFFELFYESHYLLMSISTIMLFAWFMTPYFYLVDHMVGSGYDESQGSLVLSVIGVANTIGMVGFGWLGDQEWTSVPKMYAVSCMCCGVCCSLMYEFTMNYIVLNIFSFFYGIFLASSFAFTPVLLMEILPLETFTKAYGLQLMCQGLGHLIGPPLAAYLADVSYTWRITFHVSSVCIFLCGLCILAIPYTKNRKLIGSGLTEKEKEELSALDN